MTISVKGFRDEFAECLLNFLWVKWSQMGVYGSSELGSEPESEDRWMTDPEPLLPFTLEIGREDARVFDEVLDWLFKNSHWINTQRLSTIVKQDGTSDPRLAGAVAAVIADREKASKWRGLAERCRPQDTATIEPLFCRQAKPLPSSDSMDTRFSAYGFARSPVETRNLSRPVNMAAIENFVFKARAVFGVGIRADVMVYLISNGSGHPRRIASLLGYNAMRVNEVMSDLAQAGIVKVRPEGNTKQYWLEPEKWWSFLTGSDDSPPKWIDWRALMRGLTSLWRSIRALKGDELDEYIFSSEMRQAMRAAQNDLYASGIGFEIEDDRPHLAENYAAVFLRNIKGILGTK